MTPIVCALTVFIQTQPLAAIGSELVKQLPTAFEAAGRLGERGLPLAPALCKIIVFGNPDTAVLAADAIKRIRPRVGEVALRVRSIPASNVERFVSELRTVARALNDGTLNEQDARCFVPMLVDRSPFWRGVVHNWDPASKGKPKAVTAAEEEAVRVLLGVLHAARDQSDVHLAMAFASGRSYAEKQLGIKSLALIAATASDETTRRIVETITLGLKSGFPGDKIAAVRALSQLGSKAASSLPTLKNLTIDTDANVRRAAEAAIAKIEK